MAGTPPVLGAVSKAHALGPLGAAGGVRQIMQSPAHDEVIALPKVPAFRWSQQPLGEVRLDEIGPIVVERASGYRTAPYTREARPEMMHVRLSSGAAHTLGMVLPVGASSVVLPQSMVAAAIYHREKMLRRAVHSVG